MKTALIEISEDILSITFSKTGTPNYIVHLTNKDKVILIIKRLVDSNWNIKFKKQSI